MCAYTSDVVIYSLKSVQVPSCYLGSKQLTVRYYKPWNKYRCIPGTAVLFHGIYRGWNLSTVQSITSSAQPGQMAAALAAAAHTSASRQHGGNLGRPVDVWCVMNMHVAWWRAEHQAPFTLESFFQRLLSSFDSHLSKVDFRKRLLKETYFQCERVSHFVNI